MIKDPSLGLVYQVVISVREIYVRAGISQTPNQTPRGNEKNAM
jgi:hypothetical protein